MISVHCVNHRRREINKHTHNFYHLGQTCDKVYNAYYTYCPWNWNWNWNWNELTSLWCIFRRNTHTHFFGPKWFRKLLIEKLEDKISNNQNFMWIVWMSSVSSWLVFVHLLNKLDLAGGTVVYVYVTPRSTFISLSLCFFRIRCLSSNSKQVAHWPNIKLCIDLQFHLTLIRRTCIFGWHLCTHVLQRNRSAFDHLAVL